MSVEPKLEELKINGVAPEEEDDDKVTPWEVTTTKATGIDYDKLIGEFFFSEKFEKLISFSKK